MHDLGWTLPLAKSAYKNRDDLAKSWRFIAERLLGKQASIALTGMAGVGKTVLAEHLSGSAFHSGYEPPGTSQHLEKQGYNAHHKRIRLSVVPGQMSAPRLEATDAVFGAKPVEGVLHVVSFGFVAVRSPAARDSLVAQVGLTTVEMFRQYQLRAELDDLRSVCELIRSSYRRSKKPTWLLVAVDKADLFAGQLGDAERRYAPSADSEFAEVLRELQGNIGSDHFRWDAVPACGWLENFTWNGATVESTLKPAQRDHLLANLGRVLEAYCG